MSDLPMGRGFFVNSNFHGNVTFNFHSSEMGLSQKNVFNQQVQSLVQIIRRNLPITDVNRPHIYRSSVISNTNTGCFA
ncbi:hypothetical protein DPMN_168752 [Dreissena polymorpha]|uniref:Uncharacterized protein n=1 Tax=Dreissena polymorpha TaxID=45954 RepID=A0A9D4IXI9_DREPO|nr:hypothetical protein DPMN_168752 [Dreissena polymorpha]